MLRLSVNAAALAGALFALAPAAAQDAPPDLPAEIAALLEAAAASDTPGDLEALLRLIEPRYGEAAILASAQTLDAAAAERVSDMLAPAPEAVEQAQAAEPLADPVPPEAAEPEPDSRLEALTQLPAAVGAGLINGRSELWEGRASLGLRFDSGNAERADYSVGLELTRKLAEWGFEGAIDYAYSEVDDRVGRDELNVKARGERELGERWTTFISGDYEQDALSGFDHNAFLGLGVGYRVLDRETLSWTLRASPGARYLAPEGRPDFVRPAGDFTSDFATQLGENVTLELDTHVLVSDNSRAEQTAKLVTGLGELWAFEIKYRYRYEFDPEPGFEEADTRADISIVREF